MSRSQSSGGDLVMLTVDPKFKLDLAFHGPYRVHQVTSTRACIQPVNQPDKEIFCIPAKVVAL